MIDAVYRTLPPIESVIFNDTNEFNASSSSCLSSRWTTSPSTPSSSSSSSSSSTSYTPYSVYSPQRSGSVNRSGSGSGSGSEGENMALTTDGTAAVSLLGRLMQETSVGEDMDTMLDKLQVNECI